MAKDKAAEQREHTEFKRAEMHTTATQRSKAHHTSQITPHNILRAEHSITYDERLHHVHNNNTAKKRLSRCTHLPISCFFEDSLSLVLPIIDGSKAAAFR